MYQSSVQKVYPRVGGGATVIRPSCDAQAGLSPRGRGSRDIDCNHRHREGSIPAWAGEPNSSSILLQPYRVYPRVGGGAGQS